MFAFTIFFNAVTKCLSPVSCSFHHPYWAENCAHIYISFTEVLVAPMGNGVQTPLHNQQTAHGNPGFEITNPVRHPKMAQVSNRHYFPCTQTVVYFISKRPIITRMAQESLV